MEETTQVNFEWRKGTTQTIPLTFYDKDGIAQDITGASVYFTMKEKITDTDANAKIKKIVTTHTNPVGGETEISLTPTDTNQTVGNYVYDVFLKLATSEVYFVFDGSIAIKQNVLQTIT